MALLKAIRMQINNEWIKNKVTQNILKIFEGADHNAYLVGGCIRNSILNIPVTDIDISTDATPQQTVDLFNRENFKVAPTGFSHGTVTVISENIPYQITTMRSDQNTDGRHADVVFSDDIKKDAERRDFTINALYADSTGKIINPIGGLEDFNPLAIKFIGDPNNRIQEDYLRILRFFRFHAQFSELVTQFDKVALDAIKKNQDGLKKLSKERIWSELKKILSTSNPARSLYKMSQLGILEIILENKNVHNLKRFNLIEKKMGLEPEPIRRLVAITENTENTFLNLSRKEAKKFSLLKGLLKKKHDPAELVYQFNREIAQSVLAIYTFYKGEKLKLSDIKKIEKACLFPCPITGAQISKYLDGAAVGIKIKEAQRAWINSNFKSDEAKILSDIGIKTSTHS